MLLDLRKIALLPLLTLLGCQATTESTELPPQPPMWVVSDSDSEITLYPTLHILPDNVTWKSEELTKRLADADEIWFEIMPGADADAALQQKTLELGMAPGTSLSANLTEEEIAALKAATAPLGMPFEAVDMMRPWMASTMVSVGALVENGFNPASGVEKQIEPMVKGKTIRALETAESQLRMLASLPDDVQMEMLRQTLGEMDETLEMVNELVKDWSVGDVEDLETEVVDEMKNELPTAFEMKGSGTDFIAVGAGHLVGEDGVPAMLKARGYDVKRL